MDVSDHNLLQIVDIVRKTSATHCKLILIAGALGLGKTTILRRMASELNSPVVNLSLLLSRRLLGLNSRQRALHVKQIAMDLIENDRSAAVCIDNTELLFDPGLQLNPLQFLQEAARNRCIVATWNGSLKNGHLTYSWPGHPEAFDQPANGFPVVALTTTGVEIHLTA